MLVLLMGDLACVDSTCVIIMYTMIVGTHDARDEEVRRRHVRDSWPLRQATKEHRRRTGGKEYDQRR